MKIIRTTKKVFKTLRRKSICNLMYVSVGKYMRKYVKFLRKQGMDIEGFPNYISNDVHFDGKDYSIIHLGDGCTISREVLFLTHDYSRHTVYKGLEGVLDEQTLECLKKRDSEDFILDLRGIYVGAHTFIGARTTLLPGTHIGNNCLVGAGSVVKGTYPDNTILFGNPAKAYTKTDEWLEKNMKKYLEEQKND